VAPTLEVLVLVVVEVRRRTPAVTGWVLPRVGRLLVAVLAVQLATSVPVVLVETRLLPVAVVAVVEVGPAVRATPPRTVAQVAPMAVAVVVVALPLVASVAMEVWEQRATP
jgi:hypothetical protein